jgi:MFS family permease
VSIYFLGFAIGSMLWGNVSDRIGKRKPVMLAVSGAHVLGWGLWLSGMDAGRLDDLRALRPRWDWRRPGLTLSWASGQGSQSAAALGHGHQRGECRRLLRPGDTAAGGRLAHGTHLGRSNVEAGVRIYSATDWHNGLLLMTASAVAGWIAVLFVRETGCRNIYRETRQ